MSTRTGHAYAYWKKGREEEKKKTRGTYAGLIHGKRKKKLNGQLHKKPKSTT